MFETFFRNYTGNQGFADEVEETFTKGGYYRYDLSENVTVLSLNTLPYNIKQN